MVSIVSINHITSGFIFLVLFPPPCSVQCHISNFGSLMPSSQVTKSELTISPCSQNTLPMSSVSVMTSLLFSLPFPKPSWKIHNKISPYHFCLITLTYWFSYPSCHILGSALIFDAWPIVVASSLVLHIDVLFLDHHYYEGKEKETSIICIATVIADGDTNMRVSVFEPFTLYKKQAQIQKNVIKYGKSKTTLCIMCYEWIVYLKVTFPSLHRAKLCLPNHAFCSLGYRRALE